MKKIALFIAVAGIVSLSSCAKDVVCTTGTDATKITVTVTAKDYTTCSGVDQDNCTTTDIVSPLTQTNYVDALKLSGFDCE